MASYSKRMMEEAKPWLEANPDPDDPFVRHPRSASHARDFAVDRARLARYEKAMRDDPSLAMKPSFVAGLQQLRVLISELEEDTTDIQGLAENVDDAINQIGSEVHHKMSQEHGQFMLGRWFLSWARHGHNAFDLSADFTAAMLLTDPREIEAPSLEIPFPALLISIPDGFVRGAEGGHYTKIHVLEMTHLEGHQLQQIKEIAGDMPVADRADLVRTAVKEHRAARLSNTVPPPTWLVEVDRALTSKRLLFFLATDGTHSLQTFIDRDRITWDALDRIDDQIEDDTDKRAQRTLWHIVMGMFAYVGAVEHAVEPKDAPARVRKGGDRAAPKHWEVGRTIKIGPELVRAAREGSRELAFRLKHRHIVRGHYRNQAHGEGRKDRRKIWIAPHWKGPEDGAVLVHTYKLGAPTSEGKP